MVVIYEGSRMLKKSAGALKRATGENGWFVLFAWSVWLSSINQTNKTNQVNQINLFARLFYGPGYGWSSRPPW